MSTLRALDIEEERLLAGRVAGIMYVLATASAALLLVLPGVDHSHPVPVVLLAGTGMAWGVLCLTRLDWRGVSPVVSHFSSILGLALTAGCVAATGGASSPARFYVLFNVIYAAYFYPRREAIPYLLACSGILISPLAYQDGAMTEGFLAELVVLVPILGMLGGVVMIGKQGLLELRDSAKALSLRDPLTDLPNRRALLALLDGHAAAAGGERERAGDNLALVLLDLDHFKRANTVYGHVGGDRVLLAAADALSSAARTGDMVARLGGDEFAIVCRGISADGVRALADRVLAALAERNDALDMPEFRLSASLGSAAFPGDADGPEQLIEAADRHMREAKRAGRNRAVLPLAA